MSHELKSGSSQLEFTNEHPPNAHTHVGTQAHIHKHILLATYGPPFCEELSCHILDCDDHAMNTECTAYCPQCLRRTIHASANILALDFS